MAHNNLAVTDTPRVSEALLTQLQSLLRLSAGYFILVAFGFIYLAYFKEVIAPIYAYSDVKAISGREWDETLTVWLTPLPILLCGTRLRSAGSFIIPVLFIFLLLPTPLFLVQNISLASYWNIYPFLWLAGLTVCAATNISLKLSVKKAQPARFARIITICAITTLLLMLYSARNGITLGSIRDIYQLRAELSLGAIESYTLSFFNFSLGGLFVGLAISRKRYLLAGFCLMGFLLVYGVVAVKSALLAPLWIAFLYLGVKHFVREHLYRYYILLMTPLLLVASLHLMFPEQETLQFINGIVGFRLYVVPAQAFIYYQEFFASHPFTNWSQITGLNWVLDYPFDAPLSVLMNQYFDRGNVNASFLLTEGLASGGLYGMLPASVMLGAVMCAFNTACKGLPRNFLAMFLALPANMLHDVPLATSVVSGGLVLTMWLVAVMPPSFVGGGDPSDSR